MLIEAVTLAALVTEPVRYRYRRRVRRHHVERLEKEPPCCWPKLEPPPAAQAVVPPRQPTIRMIIPYINANTFKERFEALPEPPARKGDKLKPKG